MVFLFIQIQSFVVRCQIVYSLSPATKVQNFAETIKPHSVRRHVNRNTAITVNRCAENLQNPMSAAGH
jgi:hypothetical protein